MGYWDHLALLGHDYLEGFARRVERKHLRAFLAGKLSASHWFDHIAFLCPRPHTVEEYIDAIPSSGFVEADVQIAGGRVVAASLYSPIRVRGQEVSLVTLLQPSAGQEPPRTVQVAYGQICLPELRSVRTPLRKDGIRLELPRDGQPYQAGTISIGRDDSTVVRFATQPVLAYLQNGEPTNSFP